ncbi:MAG: hypothetical protein FD130_2211, partial [Halothiobacillaceae bacterium]
MMTLAQLARIVEAAHYTGAEDRLISGVTIDSRRVN